MFGPEEAEPQLEEVATIRYSNAVTVRKAACRYIAADSGNYNVYNIHL